MGATFVAFIFNHPEPFTGIGVNDAPIEVHTYPLSTLAVHVAECGDAYDVSKSSSRSGIAVFEADRGKPFT